MVDVPKMQRHDGMRLVDPVCLMFAGHSSGTRVSLLPCTVRRGTATPDLENAQCLVLTHVLLAANTPAQLRVGAVERSETELPCFEREALAVSCCGDAGLRPAASAWTFGMLRDHGDLRSAAQDT